MLILVKAFELHGLYTNSFRGDFKIQLPVDQRVSVVELLVIV